MPSPTSQTKYVVVLAVVSALVLVVGSRLKPEAASESPVSASDILRLQLATQRRNLEDLASYFAGVANSVKPGILWLDELRASGIVWESGGGVITAAPQGIASQRITSGGIRLEPEILGPCFPVASVKATTSTALQPVFRASAAGLAQGSWILQISAKEGGGHLYAPGTYGGLNTIQCGDYEVRTVETNLPLDRSWAGGGVFDVDGHLLGVVLGCGAEYAAVTPASVDQILRFARGFEGLIIRRYGFRVTALDQPLQDYFETSRGLLVTEVWDGRPAARGGLLPGDIIQALDDSEVTQLDDLARLVLPVAYPAFDLWVWRGGKTVKVGIPASSSEFAGVLDELPAQGILLEPPQEQEGYLITEVAPGSRAEKASLRGGDRLLLIAGRQPRDLDAARRVLADRAQGPVFVVVRRGHKKLGALLK